MGREARMPDLTAVGRRSPCCASVELVSRVLAAMRYVV